LDSKNRKTRPKILSVQWPHTEPRYRKMPGKEKSLDGWIRLSPEERTYSLILEVAKQLKKLEALSERLGSEENGGVGTGEPAGE
jgi:hypothetical protein